jgi:type I restriction enzyme S subunit
MRYVGLEHIEPHSMRLLGHSYAREVRSSSARFSMGDILYGKMRPYLNKVWVAEFDGLCSAEFLVFQKSNGLNSQFLALRLNAEDFVTFANGQVSGERPRIDFEKLSHFPILLPPIAEQERIAGKLTSSLLRLGRAGRATGRAQQRLKRYRAAVLDAAVAGKLSRAFRETSRKNQDKDAETGEDLLQRLLSARRARWEEAESKRFRIDGKSPKNEDWKSRYPEPEPPDADNLTELPKRWTWGSLDQCFQVERGRFSVRPRNDPAYYNGKHPFVQIGDLPPDGGPIREYSQTLNEEGIRVSKKFPRGTILLAIVGATIANTGVLTFDACCPDSLVAIQSDDATLLAFADLWLRASKLKLRGAAIASGGQPNINLGILRPFAIPLPPISEQNEIVREVEIRLSAADRLAVTLKQQGIRASAARQSLLSEAFAGRLVGQDPNDEPASLLLDHIRAAREAEAQKPKGKRMSKSKPEVKAVGRRGLLAVLNENGGQMTPEQLFRASGHSQESVDQFFAELRALTTPPAKITEERKIGTRVILRVVS